MDRAHRSVALFVLLAFVTVACGREGAMFARRREPVGSARVTVYTPPPKKALAKRPVPAALHAFADCAEIIHTLRTQAIKYVGPYGLGGAYGGGFDVVTMGGAATGVAAGSSRAASGSVAASVAPGPAYSGTNVQEEGVDEPDVVETDGRRIFAVSGQTLHAAVIDDGAPRLVGKLTLDSRQPQLMLAGDRLIVVGGARTVPGRGTGGGGSEIMTAHVHSPQTLVQIVDVSAPSAMRVASTLTIDGSLVSSRAVDGVARVVIRRAQPQLDLVRPQNSKKATVDRALALNRQAVSHATIDRWIPRYKLQTGGKDSEGALSSCRSTYRPTPFSGFGTVSVVTIDPASPTPREGSTVVGGGDIVYASPDALYVTTVRQPEPVPISAADTRIARPPLPPQTQIHKFDIGSTTANYLASGIVDGTVLNQYSMSELDGNLRVATTIDAARSESAVSVFAQRGPALVRIGHVGGLGVGERIHGVRFIGSVGYVVTFRQIDPLFTIDLSNPSAPKVVGELKVPGFSSYLHPVGDGLLLGIGQDTKETAGGGAIPTGAKVSLFDVSNLSAPNELDTYKVAGSQSAAQHDPHAFLWWGPRKLAVLPIEEYGQPPDDFVGVVVLRVDRADKIQWMRRIAHPKKNYVSQIVRSVISGDTLYTLSDGGILATELTSVDQETWLPFA